MRIMKKKFGWILMAGVLAVCGGAEGAGVGRMEMGADGALRVEAWGERFEQAAPKGKLTVTGRSAERIEFEYEENGFRAKGAYALNGDGSIGLKLKADADAELKGRLQYPPPWKAEKGDCGIYPFGEGMRFPVDDAEVWIPEKRLSFAFGMGLSMGVYGHEKKNALVLCGVRQWVGAGLECGTDLPRTISMEWRGVLGKWGFDREMKFFFARRLDEAAGAYRKWREGMGIVKTLEEKAKANPRLKNFPGTANFWVWDDNTQCRLYNWPLKEKTTPRDVKAISLEMKALGMDRVLWNSFEGLTAEECAHLRSIGYETGTYECMRDMFHKGLLKVADPANFERAARFLPFSDDIARLNGDGSPVNAWTIPDKNGKMHPMHAMCDMVAEEMCRKLIAPEVKRIGYTSRLMDVQAGLGPTYCFSKKHPCDAFGSLEAMRSEHKYLGEELQLVVGVEVGGEYLADAYHYSEGLTSCPHQYRKALCWRYKDRALYGEEVPEATRKLMHNPKYRIPLWELVYHDCTVSYYYWADSTMMYPELSRRKDLLCALYGLPPIYSMNASTWKELKERVAESYRRATPVARKTMFSRMVRHEVLGADRMVQRTRFANGVEVTVNFAQEEREGIAGESYLVEMR